MEILLLPCSTALDLGAQSEVEIAAQDFERPRECGRSEAEHLVPRTQILGRGPKNLDTDIVTCLGFEKDVYAVIADEQVPRLAITGQWHAANLHGLLL